MTSQQQPARLRLADETPKRLEYHIIDFLHAKSIYRPRTLSTYRSALNLYLDHVGPHFWPPTDSSVNSFLATCRRRNLSEQTIFNYHRMLKTFFSWLHRRGKIAENPMDFVERPPKPRHLPRAPGLADVAALFRYLEAEAAPDNWRGVRNLACVSVAFDSGLRIGELAGLKVDQVDLDRGEIRIPFTKTHESRIVVVGEATVTDLTAWVSCRAALSMSAGLTALFVSHYQTRQWRAWSSWGIRQMLTKSLKRAKLPHFRFHSLRHAFAVQFLNNGGSLADLRRELGHKSLATTSIYTLISDDGRAERHRKISPRSKL